MSTEIKDKIIEGATQLFLTQGIKTVTMDKIAATLGISKRTIYEQFTDKNTLVLECINKFKQTFDKQRDEARRKCSNSFEFLLKMFTMSFEQLQKTNLQYFIDLETLFPEVIQKAKFDKECQVKDFAELIKESQKDGYILKELSADVLAVVYYGMLNTLRGKDNYDYNKYSPIEILRIICTLYFRGVATKKGMQMIEEQIKTLGEN